MKAAIKILLCSLLLSVWLSPVTAALTKADTLKFITEAEKRSTVKNYPNSDTVLLYNVENIRYDEKGLSVSTDEYYQKALTEKGRKELRSFTFHFNTAYGTLEIEKALILRNGKILPVDAGKNSKVSIDASQMGSNIYDPANKILTLTIPGLLVGDVVGLKIKSVTTKARIPGFWGNYIALQGSMPILKYEVNVDAPAVKPLRSIVVKDKCGKGVTFTETKKGDRILYRWQAENVPQAIPEPDMPPLYTAVQRLLIGTAGSWTEISRWYYHLCRPRLDKIDDGIRNKVKELIKDCRTPEEKITALFQFVSQKIRYMGITPEAEAPGYEPHDVTLTFHNRYGVCRDKAALLAAMLEAAGLKAYPVLIMAGIPKDDDVPNGYFNHAITAVELTKGQYILMDPTNESARELLPATLGNCSYLVAKPEGDKLRRTPSPDSKANQLKIRSQAVLSGEGTLTGTVWLDFLGVNDMIYRDALSRWTPEEAKQYFSRRLNAAVPGAELKKLEILPVPLRDMSKKLQVKLTYSAEKILPENNNPVVLQLPELGDTIGASGFLLGSFALEKRQFKLQLSSTFSVSEDYSLTLPAHLRLLSLPKAEKLGDHKLIRWERSLSHKNNVLTGKRYFSVNTLEFTPAEYARGREILQKMDMKKKGLPVIQTDFSRIPFEKLPQVFPGADTLVMKDWKKWTLKDSAAWTEESERKVKVLSYAGMKEASEIRVEYNPVWEKVTINGQVTSAKGQVRRLQALEKNLMDASWNASAPRYPGAKVFVANLPGVEIGSEITVQIKREISRPYFSAIMLFAGYAPEIERVRIIDLPDCLALRRSPLPDGVEFSETRQGSRRILSWRSCNNRRIASEANQAELWSFVPQVMVSGGKWKNISQVWSRVFTRLSAPESNPRSAALARQLTAKLSNQGSEKDRITRKVKVIRDYTAQYVRSAGPGLDALPVANLSPADITLTSGYGNSADRAILLAALCRSLGINVEYFPVSSLLYHYGIIKGLEHLPQPVFSDVLLYIPALDIYLNDTTQYAVPGTLHTENKTAFSLRNSRLTVLRPPLKYENHLRKHIRLDIQENGSAQITVTDKNYGTYFETANRRFSEFTPELRRRYFLALASNFSRAARITGTPVTDFRDYPGVVQYTVNCPGFAARTGDHLTFDLPGFNTFARAVGTVEKLRATPFQRDHSFQMEMEYEITFPEKYKTAGSAAAKLLLGDYAVGTFTRHYSTSPGKLKISCKIKVPAGILASADCDKLFLLHHQLARPDMGKVVLIPRGEKK